MSARVVLLGAVLPTALRDALAARHALLGPLPPAATFAAQAAALPAADRERVRAIVTMGSVATSAAAMALFPALGLVCCIGSGHEGVDVAAAKARGIAVAHSPGANAASVADVAIGLMIASVRGFRAAARRVDDGSWRGNAAQRARVQRGLAGRRVGIFGMGAIGCEIARRARAFGVAIGYHNRRPVVTGDADVARYFATLAGLAQWCDVLMVSVRAGADTLHAVDAGILAALGADGHVINVARGSVIDEVALIDALQRGVIAGAGLDVFEHEPDVPPELIALPNVFALPHIGGASSDAQAAMQAMVLANLDAFFAGSPLPTPVRS